MTSVMEPGGKCHGRTSGIVSSREGRVVLSELGPGDSSFAYVLWVGSLGAGEWHHSGGQQQGKQKLRGLVSHLFALIGGFVATIDSK